MDKLGFEVTEIPHLLSRGFALMLIDCHLQEADKCFIGVLRQEPTKVTALLGRGCLAYNRQEYRVALGYFKTILIHYPKGQLAGNAYSATENLRRGFDKIEISLKTMDIIV